MPRGGARVGAGRKKAVPKPELRLNDVALTVTAPSGEVLASPGQTPLEYMLSVMRAASADEKLRAQMAVAAAPYLHIKMGDVGKKEQVQGIADKAATGKFKAAAPPLKLVAR